MSEETMEPRTFEDLWLMRENLPDWYARLVAMEDVLGTMKRRPLERGE